MAPPYSEKLPLNPSLCGIAQSQARMRDDIESIWRSVAGSRRTMAEARDAIARADEILARQMSEYPRR